jgi:dienelactone hydrolase
MVRRGWLSVWILAVVLSVAAAAWADEATTQTFAVQKTYNQQPFEYQMKLLVKRDGYNVYRLSYPSPVVTDFKENNTVWADYYLPSNIEPTSAKRPVVIALHILNGDMRVTDVACSVLARRGIPAVMPTLPYYNERAPKGDWHILLEQPKLFLGMLTQSVEDLRRTADVLASRSEIDPQKIDISGVSLGGIVAATVSALDTRFYRTSLFLAGGNLLKILKHARYTKGLSQRFDSLPDDQRKDLEDRATAVDPVPLASKLRERAKNGQVLMVNAAADEIIPRACTEELATALGILNRVTWIDNLEHDRFIAALPQALQMTTDFFAQDLPADVKPCPPPSLDVSTPIGQASLLIHQILTMLSVEPEKGHCHAIDLKFVSASQDKKPIETRLHMVRGSDNKFLLQCKLPVVGEITAGQNTFPWMVTASKTVMKGVKNPCKERNPLQFVGTRYLTDWRNLIGLIGCLDLVPETLDRWAGIEAKKPKSPEDPEGICISVREKFPCTATVSYQKDRKTPTEIRFEGSGVNLKIVISDWKLDADADASTFDAPKDLKAVEMQQADLYRMFSSMFSLAMQQAAK